MVKQIQCLEESADTLRGRCLKFHKGCRKYTEGLGEGYDGDIAFATSLETFGGGHNDPICVAFGGPVMNKFTIALREIGMYREILRSQVEHMLNDRLLQFVNDDLHDVKEARKRFDKASIIYDQAREKFLSLRKSTRMDVATVIEEELHHARSSFEQARFNLVSALSKVEAKKRFEFLEAVGGMMDAHLRFFKQGYDLLHQLEPFISQVLAYAQQSRECSNYEQASLNERMQEYRRQVHEESRQSLNISPDSPTGDGMRSFAKNSHKVMEAVTQSAANGKVQTIRQGYLSKRSSNLRGDWKRRFFVLDSRGLLYYYRKPWGFSSGGGSQSSIQRNVSSENGPGLLSRWLSSHYHGGVHDEKSVARHTVNLLTSTIKIDADQSDMRFCFRIISPMKIYTLQAENAQDQMDWIGKITGVIASLLSFQTPEWHLSTSPMGSSGHSSDIFLADSHDINETAVEGLTSKNLNRGNRLHVSRSWQHSERKSNKPIELLRRVCGNDRCADCNAPEPDWASLNLGVLVCIECSGVHRNLGVHISKVRSLTLDVKVWEPSVLNLFQSIGNTYANSIWEEMLHLRCGNVDEVPEGLSKSDGHKEFLIKKPSHDDPISMKEKFINTKYAEKKFVLKMKDNQHVLGQQLWESVHANDKRAVYRCIVCSEADVIAHGQEFFGDSFDKISSSCLSSVNKNRDQLIEECYDGCSLLHLACLNADVGMVELLLQYGANVNASDSRGRTPLHHCVISRRTEIAKLLLMRGANRQAADKEGITADQLASESALEDSDLFALLKETNR
ncbi:ADP-ribosylation factor GTPase-activating protein AGD1 isoform X2 [Tripterygium wilfordii]|uniref:ADP-ribosylation factor GTPase-activating protein AGD1 isoform X2 n=1 Tax=Tripterygium wilfordii TaxID=458696 RepID=UPI0018F823C0|nr:ADP-ribosylation factor GTPase-activating protein AGD1 isoform X2 [Tripterygium wilfordii]XP_038708109.1 ADP-ribosylation factor GTPase-activating protein AGD1 isoform X2 [Tripterygium wilfordii]